MDDWSVCRICLEASEERLKPFPEGSYNTIPFTNIYFQLVGTTIKEYPSFPAIICVNCEKEMVHAFKFREKCIETEEKLSSSLAEESTGKVDADAVEFIAEAKDDRKSPDIEKNEAEVFVDRCRRNYENLERKLSRSRIEKLKSRVIQCKRCKGLFKGLDLFKFHKCFHTEEKKEQQEEVDNVEESIAPVEDEVGSTIEIPKEKKKTVRKTYKCEICSETFHHLSTLNTHVDRHNNVARYACAYCEERFTCWIQRRTHTYRKHLKTTHCQCEKCGKGFYTKYALKVHMQRDHYNNTFQCDQCGKTLMTNRGLWEHRQTHNDSLKFACNICGKQLKSKGTLNQHKKTHTGEKNYVCPVCSRGFTCNFSLKNHVRKQHPDDVHLLPPDGTIVNKKYLEKLAEEETQ